MCTHVEAALSHAISLRRLDPLASVDPAHDSESAVKVALFRIGGRQCWGRARAEFSGHLVCLASRFVL